MIYFLSSIFFFIHFDTIKFIKGYHGCFHFYMPLTSKYVFDIAVCYTFKMYFLLKNILKLLFFFFKKISSHQNHYKILKGCTDLMFFHTKFIETWFKSNNA
jgi:hypothetical protein